MLCFVKKFQTDNNEHGFVTLVGTRIQTSSTEQLSDLWASSIDA